MVETRSGVAESGGDAQLFSSRESADDTVGGDEVADVKLATRRSQQLDEVAQAARVAQANRLTVVDDRPRVAFEPEQSVGGGRWLFARRGGRIEECSYAARDLLHAERFS